MAKRMLGVFLKWVCVAAVLSFLVSIVSILLFDYEPSSFTVICLYLICTIHFMELLKDDELWGLFKNHNLTNEDPTQEKSVVIDE